MLDEAVRDDLLEAPVEREQRVTALELFFDLVFVFAITQVTGFLYHDPTWTRVAEAFAILMVLWFAWTAYAWLGNTAGSDEGTMRVVLLAAMAPLLVASLAVPHAFGKDALVFGVAYFLVRTLHLVEYALLARGNPELQAAVVRLSRTILPAAGLLVLAGLLPEPLRAFCWAAALAIDYGGLLLSSIEGWRVEPAHFAGEQLRFIVARAPRTFIVADIKDFIHAGVEAVSFKRVAKLIYQAENDLVNFGMQRTITLAIKAVGIGPFICIRHFDVRGLVEFRILPQ